MLAHPPPCRFSDLWCWVSVPRQGWCHLPAWGPWRSVAEPPAAPSPATSKSSAGLAALEDGCAVAPPASAGTEAQLHLQRSSAGPAASAGGQLKAVLRGVSGVARRGELVGVLGPSGERPQGEQRQGGQRPH